MDKNELITLLKEHKKVLKDNFQITKIGLFGSYTKNTYTTQSDVDLIFESEKKIGLKDIYELEFFFKQLLKIDKIDLINRQYVNPILSDEIENTVVYV